MTKRLILMAALATGCGDDPRDLHAVVDCEGGTSGGITQCELACASEIPRVQQMCSTTDVDGESFTCELLQTVDGVTGCCKVDDTAQVRRFLECE